MEEQTALFDAMRDAAVERLRFQRRGEALRIVAARRESDWTDPASVLDGNPREALEAVGRMFLAGGHERLDLVFRSETGLRFICAVHSTASGPGAGGLRRLDPVVPELDVIQEALDLARAMTFKNLVAGVGRGGSKLVVHNTPLPEYDRDAWLDVLAEEIDLSGTLTGPDTGFPTSVFHDLALRTTNVTGLRGGGTGLSAAYGVLQALHATTAALGLPMNESRVVVQGLGSVGSALATDIAKEGGRLTVSDRDHRKIDAFLSGLSQAERRQVGVVAPYQVLDVECDVFSPCAVGGLITRNVIRSLRCRAICGGANNQLAAHSLAEEIELARELNVAGILYVPDWLTSAGGTIHASMEQELGDAFDLKKVQARIRRVCGWEVDELLLEAKRTGRPPIELAVERFLRR